MNLTGAGTALGAPPFKSLQEETTWPKYASRLTVEGK
jgi:hypothetical protein